MRLLLLMCASFALAPSPPTPPPFRPALTDEQRVDQFTGLWSACDSVTDRYRSATRDGDELEARNTRYALSLFWAAAVWEYDALTAHERKVAWDTLFPGFVGRPELLGATFRRFVGLWILPDTPRVPRRLAQAVHDALETNLEDLGVDGKLVETIRHYWPPAPTPKAPPPSEGGAVLFDR